MPRPASLVPLVTFSNSHGEEHRAKGLPLPQLFAEVMRLVWAPGMVSPSRRLSAARTMSLAASLNPHPNPGEVADWYQALRRLFPSEHTSRLHLLTLAAVFKYGADLTLSSGNPAARVAQNVPRPKGDPRPVENIAEKWPRFVGACATPREALFIGLQRFGGLRRGEALGLWHSDVNTYREPWRLEVVRQRRTPNDLATTWPKSESGCRELPVRGPLRDLLAPVLAEGEPVVRVGRGGGERARVPYLCPLREQDLEDLGERLRAVSPEDFPRGHKMWHALRDTWFVELLRGGKAARSEIAKAGGHSNEYVTNTHYFGHVGRVIHESIFEGLDPPTCGPAPPGGETAAVESREAGASTPAPRRRSKAGHPGVNQEAQRCSTPSTAEKSSRQPSGKLSKTPGRSEQRSLPRLAAGPVVRRPRR